MGILSPTPERAVITSRKTIVDGALVFTSGYEVLYAQLGAPVGGSDLGGAKRRSTRPVGGGGSVSPRWKFQTWMRYPEDAIVGDPPQPGSLLAINGVPHEVSEDASYLSQGTRPVGWEIAVVDVSLCYPTDCSILNSAGDVVTAARIAMWSPTESFDDRGERIDDEAEAPASLYAALSPRNTQISVGARVWRVTKCVLDLDLGRVSMTVRETLGDD